MAGSERKINWMLLIGGIALVVCGVVTFFEPASIIGPVMLWAGIGFLVSGVAGFVSFLMLRKVQEGTGLSLFMAVLDLVIGALLIAYPQVFSLGLPWLLGVAFIAFGILEIGCTFPFREIIPESRSVMVISGILAIIVGIMFIVWTASSLIWVSAFALVRGITLIAIGLTARS